MNFEPILTRSKFIQVLTSSLWNSTVMYELSSSTGNNHWQYVPNLQLLSIFNFPLLRSSASSHKSPSKKENICELTNVFEQ